MSRCGEITRFIRKFDRDLYCEREENLYVIKRKGKRARSFDYEGDTYTYFVDEPYQVMALTHNWSIRGAPVDWGLDNILKRLQEIDSWNRDPVGEIKAHNQKYEESRKRTTRNEIEAWASDSRSVFKEAFKDVNTSTVEKIDRRRLKDKSIKI